MQVVLLVEEIFQGVAQSQQLAKYSGDRCTLDAHVQDEYEDRVHDCVGNDGENRQPHSQFRVS